jgi:hypothetical protein
VPGADQPALGGVQHGQQLAQVGPGVGAGRRDPVHVGPGDGGRRRLAAERLAGGRVLGHGQDPGAAHQRPGVVAGHPQRQLLLGDRPDQQHRVAELLGSGHRPVGGVLRGPVAAFLGGRAGLGDPQLDRGVAYRAL